MVLVAVLMVLVTKFSDFCSGDDGDERGGSGERCGGGDRNDISLIKISS